MTCDTAHVLADAATSRELAYVGLTRGREANHLYVETEDAQPVSDVLGQIAGNADGMLSATETIRAEQARVDDLVTLVDQYGDVADRADVLRFEKVADQALGADAAAALREHQSWGAVEGALRHAESQGLDPADVLYQSWTERDMEGIDDVPAALSARIASNTAQHVAALPYEQQTEAPAVPSWIADRRAIDSRHTASAWRDHMAERYNYLALRLDERGEALAAEPPAWAGQLGSVPTEAARREEWTRLAAEVATFRDRFKVPETEAEAVPAAYRGQAIGKDLQERVVASHKSDALRDATSDRRERLQAVMGRGVEDARRRREAWEAAHGRRMTSGRAPAGTNRDTTRQKPTRDRDTGLER